MLEERQENGVAGAERMKQTHGIMTSTQENRTALFYRQSKYKNDQVKST